MNGWYVTLKLTFHVYYYVRTDERMVNNFKTKFYVYYYVRTDERMVHKFKTNISHELLRQDR